MAVSENRAVQALRRRHNWVQLAKFCAIGATGYAVNLAVYKVLLDGANLYYLVAATGSFLVAATNNYWWNRHWTFADAKGHFGYQGLRFFIISAVAYVTNLALLTLFVEVGGLGKFLAQAISIVLVTPVNFIGNKLWSFRH